MTAWMGIFPFDPDIFIGAFERGGIEQQGLIVTVAMLFMVIFLAKFACLIAAVYAFGIAVSIPTFLFYQLRKSVIEVKADLSRLTGRK